MTGVSSPVTTIDMTLDKREAEEIRTAFSEIASGISRLGVALSSIFATNTPTTPSPSTDLSRVGPLFYLDTAPSTAATPEVPTTLKVKNKSKASKKRSSVVASDPATSAATNTATTDEADAVVVKSVVKSPKPPRDPNAPKRPKSSFLLFADANRDRLIRENIGTPYGEVTKMLGHLWESADKKPFDEAAHVLMVKWKAACEEYAFRKKYYEDTGSLSTLVEVASNAHPEPANQVSKKKKKVVDDKGKETVAVSSSIMSIQDEPSPKKAKASKATSNTSDFVGDKGPLLPTPIIQDITPVTPAPSVESVTDASVAKPKKKRNKKTNTDASASVV